MKAYQAASSNEAQAMALARKGDVLSIHGSHDWTAFRRASEALNDVTSQSSKRLGYHFVRSFVRVMARGQNGSEFRTALRVAEEWIASGRLNDAEVRHLLDGMAEGHAYRYSMTGEGYHRREALRCYTRAGEFQNLVASTELALRYLRLPLLLAEFDIPELVDTSGQQALQLQRRAKELGSPRVYTATKQMQERLVAKGIIKPKQS